MPRIMMSFNDGSQPFEVTSLKTFTGWRANFTRLARAEFNELSYQLLANLKLEYTLMQRSTPGSGRGTMNPRKRIDNRPPLEDRINQSLKVAEVKNSPTGAFAFHVMDLGMLRDLTSEGYVGTGGWIDLFEDTLREGRLPPSFSRRGASTEWGFVHKNTALAAAVELATQEELPGYYRKVFLAFVANVFKGKHDEGIMVRLDRPIFYNFHDRREPGKILYKPIQEYRVSDLSALRALHTHPGILPTNVWRTVLWHNQETVRLVEETMHNAIEKAKDWIRLR